MRTIDEIRAIYSNPQRGNTPGTMFEDDYCVGGALVRATLGFANFPSIDRIEHALCVLNPSLTAKRANAAAQAIVALNDSGIFDSAWERAKREVTHRA